MNAITPFVFEDQLVRTIARSGEPWFVGRDVCAVLEISNESQALARLDDDERAGYVLDTQFGAKETIIVSEPGVFRLIFTSRKPAAERFKRWLAHEVLPALRRTGAYALPEARPAVPPALDEAPASAFSVKLALVREARLIFGLRRAQALWAFLGLPDAPEAGPLPDDHARDALRLLLMEDAAGMGLGERIAAALDDVVEEQLRLPEWGIRITTRGPEGFLVSNRHPWLAHLFRETPCDRFRWPFVLRRLPGVAPAGTQRFGQFQTRATFVPARYLDLDALPMTAA